MAYTTINKSTDYFNTKLYTGNGGTQSITGVGFQPDMAWIKSRSSGAWHHLGDAVRGADKRLQPNDNGAESTLSTGITSFDSDGLSFGASGDVNGNGLSIVGWNWKAGTTAIPSGSTTDPLGVSINTTSGFGIYKITSPASGCYVLKHGLGKKPKMVIVKDLEASQKFMVWSDTFSNATNDYITLNDVNGKATYSTCWGTMNSTDCTISVGGTLDANNDHVVYIFTDTTGYCKHGSYTGNGNDGDGPFIYTGFKPAFFMIKQTDASQPWLILDSKRGAYNVNQSKLFPNASDVENTDTSNGMDFLSNGIKLKRNNAESNGSNGNYIYMAFGAAPLVGSNGVTAKAR